MKISIKSENSSHNFESNLARKFLIHPFNEGLFGFGILFLIVLSTKFFSSLIDSSVIFTVDTNDILLSSLGFICFFLISILKNFSDD